MKKRTVTELLKGTLQTIILDVLAEGKSCYGLEIIRECARRGVPVAEGTTYPVLNRLATAGLVSCRWRTSEAKGHPRKYYRLTAAGRRELAELQDKIRKLATAAGVRA